MSLQNALASAIYGTITSATAVTSLLAGTTSVYYMRAPDNATLPYIVFNFQAMPEPNESAHRVVNADALIKCYSGASALAAGSINVQVDPLFDAKILIITGWTNIRTERVEEVALVEEIPNGSPVWMSGGIYRISTEKT